VSAKSELAGVNLLELAPVCLADSDAGAERVVVVRPRSYRPGLRGLLDRLIFLMSARRIRLDDVGSFAWRRFDGQTTVAEIVAAARDEFGAAVEPAEDRMGRFVRLLHREGLVAYAGLDESTLSSV